MLLFSVVLLVLFLRSIKTSALPSITKFPNSASISAPRSAITGCALNCDTTQTDLTYLSWAQASITATYTLETMLLIINNQTNSTRTSTIKNTDINFANISIPTNTNSAGTVTTMISVGDGNTITATFPSTPYEDYPSTYAFCGTLPTVISGTSTCLTIQSETCAISGYSASGLNSNNGVFTFPSHPPISVGVQTGLDLRQDPRGWTYMAMLGIQCDGAALLLKPLFPDLEIWSCGGTASCAAPAMVLGTALYLTVTSTSHEAGPATPPTTIPQTPGTAEAHSPGSSLVTAPTNSHVPNNTPIRDQNNSLLQPASNNEPTPAQLTMISLSPLSQPVFPNQLAANNSPSPVQQAATSQPDPNDQPPPNNQPAANNFAIPKALSTESSLVAAPTNSPVPNNTPIRNQNNSSLQPASNNEPTPAQPITTSLSPPSQPVSPNQPATNNSPSPVQQAATSQPDPSNQPPPNNQPAANNLPTSVPPAAQPLKSPNQSAPNNRPASHPPPPPSATIVPIAVTSTNTQGSILVSTAPVAAIPVLQTSTQIGGQTVVSTSFSPLIPNAPITINPGAVLSTDAQGSASLMAALVPVAIFTTDSKGETVTTRSLSLSPVAASHPVSPIAFLPTAITATNAQGITTTSTGIAAIIPIVASSTNPQGQVVVSSSLLTAAATAPTNVVIISTDAKGSIVSSTAQVPAVILTTTNAQGSQIILTSPITQPLIAIATTPPIMIGTQVVGPNSQSQYIIGSQTLTLGGAITVSGTPILLVPSATRLISGTSTQNLVAGTTNLPILTIGSQTVTANSASQYIIASQTLTPGGAITISGTLISLAPSAIALIIGSSTISLDSSATIFPPLTIGTQVVTANNAGQYVVSGLTLTPGAVVTVSGTRVSLEAGDTGVVVGTSIEALGPLITAGLGSGPGGNGISGVKPFTGSGVKAWRTGNLSLWLEGFIMVFGMRALMGL